jgi:hypothetical protein
MQWYLNTQFFSTEGPLLTLQPFKKEICCSASFTDNSKIFELNAIQKNLLNAAMKKKSVQFKKNCFTLQRSLEPILFPRHSKNFNSNFSH